MREWAGALDRQMRTSKQGADDVLLPRIPYSVIETGTLNRNLARYLGINRNPSLTQTYDLEKGVKDNILLRQEQVSLNAAVVV